MQTPTLRDLGARISSAFHLSSKPLVAYGSETQPEDGVPLSSVHRCIATTMVRMAAGQAPATVFLGSDVKSGCCPGGLSHTGFILAPPSHQLLCFHGKARHPGCSG